MITRRTLFATLPAAALSLTVASMVPANAQMMAKASGMFEGRSNHVTTGSVEIIEEGGRSFVVLGEDFSLDNGPDPRVGFGKDGEYQPDAYLGALLDLSGKQRYAVPSIWDASEYTEVFIWCEVAGVPLGVASLK